MERLDSRRDDLPIPLGFRCPKRWAELEGDGARRHCASCDFDVHDVSAMTPARAERFLAARDERTCITYLYRPDGSVVFAEPPLRSGARRWFARAGAVLALVLSPLAACRRSSSESLGAPAEGSDAARAPGRDESLLVGDGTAPGREPMQGSSTEVTDEVEPLTAEEIELLRALGY